jgi:hypothetical protein
VNGHLVTANSDLKIRCSVENLALDSERRFDTSGNQPITSLTRRLAAPPRCPLDPQLEVPKPRAQRLAQVLAIPIQKLTKQMKPTAVQHFAMRYQKISFLSKDSLHAQKIGTLE